MALAETELTTSRDSAGTIPVSVDLAGDVASLTFDRFDLDAYAFFLRVKALPESQVSYVWRCDAYTVTTPARFAAHVRTMRRTISWTTADLMDGRDAL